MASDSGPKTLTHALEDYLETIQQFVDQKGFARVRDICKARGVKSGSVSPAMKRLADMGLIVHAQGEYVTPTREGELIARRVRARHDLLLRFFHDILGVEDAQAEADSCAMEHHLSDTSMERLTRLFEFIQNCPQGRTDFLKRFHSCPMTNGVATACDHTCQYRNRHLAGSLPQSSALSNLEPGQTALVSRIDAEEDVRTGLLNRGFLPNVPVEMVSNVKGNRVQVVLGGHQVRLSSEEADCVKVK